MSDEIIEEGGKPGKQIKPGSGFLDQLRSAEKPVEPKAPETKAPEAKLAPADDEIPADVKSESAKKGWSALKEEKARLAKERDEWKTKYESEFPTTKKALEERERELNEVKSKFNPDEIEKLRKERDELDERLKLTDITSSKGYQDRFIKPVKEAIKTAVDAFPADHQARAKYLLNQAPSSERTDQLEALIEEAGLGRLKAGLVGNSILSIDRVKAEHDALMANQSEVVKAHEEYKQNQTKAQLAATQAEWDKALQTVRSKVESAKYPFLSKIDPTAEGASAHNAAVDEALREAAEWSKASTAEERLHVAHLAAIGKRSLNELATTRKELAEIRAQLAKLTAASPKSGAPSGEAKKGPSKSPFTEALRG